MFFCLFAFVFVCWAFCMVLSLPPPKERDWAGEVEQCSSRGPGEAEAGNSKVPREQGDAGRDG